MKFTTKIIFTILLIIGSITVYGQQTSITAKRVIATQQQELRSKRIDSLSYDSSFAGRRNTVLSTQKATIELVDNKVGYLASQLDTLYISSINTTDATVTTVDTLDIPAGYMAVVEITMLARNTSNTDVLAHKKYVTIKRIGSTYTLIGAVQDEGTQVSESTVSTATWTVTITGSVPVIRVTGIGSTNISWTAQFLKKLKLINP